MPELTFLGTGNAFAMDGRRQSCYFIKGNKCNILLDAGPCLLSALRGNKIDPKEIDYIILSHLHPDHIGGLPYFLLEDKWISKRPEPLAILVPTGGEELIRDMISLFYSDDEVAHMKQVFRFVEFNVGDVFELPNGKVIALEANHTANPKMVIINLDGSRLGYSGDTAYHPESYERLLACDVVIHEVSAFDIPIPNHVNFEELRDATPENTKTPIYMTHVDTTLVSRVSEIGSPFILAEDDLKISY